MGTKEQINTNMASSKPVVHIDETNTNRPWNKLVSVFKAFDRKVDGAISFFFKHYGKTRFMVAMSKRVQSLGIEKVWDKGPKAFIYFFLFYLVRDTILYIIIPIFFARMTGP